MRMQIICADGICCSDDDNFGDLSWCVEVDDNLVSVVFH